jgi:hypothetical protein
MAMKGWRRDSVPSFGSQGPYAILVFLLLHWLLLSGLLCSIFLLDLSTFHSLPIHLSVTTLSHIVTSLRWSFKPCLSCWSKTELISSPYPSASLITQTPSLQLPWPKTLSFWLFSVSYFRKPYNFQPQTISRIWPLDPPVVKAMIIYYCIITIASSLAYLSSTTALHS